MDFQTNKSTWVLPDNDVKCYFQLCINGYWAVITVNTYDDVMMKFDIITKVEHLYIIRKPSMHRAQIYYINFNKCD